MRSRTVILGSSLVVVFALTTGCGSNPEKISESTPEVAMALPALTHSAPDHSITFDHLGFDSGSSELTTETERLIAFATAHMNDYPNTRVVIKGHADSVGDADDNMALSIDRANAVRDQLLNYAVDPARIVVNGYGEKHPIASNFSEADRQANRRVVIVFENESN